MARAIYWHQLLSLVVLLLFLQGGDPHELGNGDRNSNDDSNSIEDRLLTILMSDVRHNRARCRSSSERKPRDVVMPIGLFGLDSCARCYGYVLDVPAFFEPLAKWNRTEIAISAPWYSSDDEPSYNITVLRNDLLNVTVLADHEDLTNAVRTSFRTENALDRWVSCCEAALRCCAASATGGRADGTADSNAACPALWDGWTCWRPTPPDALAVSQCPNYIYFDSEPPLCPRFARRHCARDGNWSRLGSAANKKTDYLPCGEMLELNKRTAVHVIAYAVSAAALVPALLIFYSYKQLNVYRIRLHKNLFASILLNAVAVIAFKALVIMPTFSAQRPNVLSLIRQNALICRLILILTRYLRLTNYMWMFCEGFYLHRLIAAAFAEQKSFAIFYLIGWGFPLVPTCLYATVRALWYDDRCWMEPVESWEWVLNAPCLLALLVNTVFLVNIIRILVNKLRTSSHAGNEPSQYRKAVRATLVLVPLFGLHFVLTIYRPPRGGCEWIEFYQYLNILLDGLQGTLVAIIFCYGNGEVHYLVKRSYKRFKEERGTGQNQRNQVPFSGSTVAGVQTCRSALIGRSTGSLTHFSVADGSPNPRSSARPAKPLKAGESEPMRTASQRASTRTSDDLLISETCAM